MAYSRDTCPEYHSLPWVWALYLCLGTSILGPERKRKQYRGGKKDEPGSDINSGGHEAFLLDESKVTTCKGRENSKYMERQL